MRLALAVLAFLLVGTPRPAVADATVESKPTPLFELRMISAALNALSRYVVDIDIRYGERSAPPMRGRVACDGQGRCLRALGLLRFLETPRWLIAVDASHRTITVSRRSGTSAPTEPPMSPDDTLAAWLRSGGEVSGGEHTIFGRHWVFTSADPSAPRAEIYADPDTRLLNRLVYETTEPGGRVEIQYRWGDPTQMDPAELAEDQFIVERGEQISPANAYADYTLIRADLR